MVGAATCPDTYIAEAVEEIVSSPMTEDLTLQSRYQAKGIAIADRIKVGL